MLPIGISCRFPEARASRRRARDSAGEPVVTETAGFEGAGFLEGPIGGGVEGFGVRCGLAFFSLTGVCSVAFFCFLAVSWCKFQAILMA